VGAREGEGGVVQTLKTVPEHRAVALGKYPRMNLDDIVGPDTDNEVIEGSVVDLAERQPIGHQWLPSGLRVRNDVSRI